MADELIDIFDESGTPRGTAMKSQAHREGLWHHSIHCWIVRPQGAGFVLFQKRGPEKDLFPNCLDISAAGHYRAGENLEDGVREIVEELGISVPYKSLIPLGIKIDVGLYGKIVNREFCHVYLLKEPRPVSEYKVNADEVTGLVEIAIPDGLAVFSGKAASAAAKGISYEAATGKWKSIHGEVKASDIIPRIDPYYLKVFIMAERLLAGKSPLAI